MTGDKFETKIALAVDCNLCERPMALTTDVEHDRPIIGSGRGCADEAEYKCDHCQLSITIKFTITN